MKVGTDSMILGAWAPLPSSGRLLDLGAGTGVLALMSAQRFPNLVIDALEIDRRAASQCLDNMNLSSWSDSFTVIPSSIQAWHGGPYDAIISNPPYFAGQHQASGFQRNQARAGNQLDPVGFVQQLDRLLISRGSVFLVVPNEDRWLEAIHSRFIIRSGIAVADVQSKDPKRLYLELVRFGTPTQPEKLALKKEVSGPYSEWYKDLTAEFHLPGAIR